MENLLAQHLSRVTDEDARSFALIEQLERANPHLSEEKLLALVERSPYGRALATRMGAPLARSISMPSVAGADALSAAVRRSEAPLDLPESLPRASAPTLARPVPRAEATASGERSPKRPKMSALSFSTSCLPE